MTRILMVVAVMLLAGCATAPVVEKAPSLFADAKFGKPTESIDADVVFRVNDGMRQFLTTEVLDRSRARGRQWLFYDALKANKIGLRYDMLTTRNAIQTFEGRAGNCLSLVIMAAAMAKELGIPVEYRRIYTSETYSRSDDLYFTTLHVNLSLGPTHGGFYTGYKAEDFLTIDFLPAEQLRGERFLVIDEKTVLAMYMNNRAAEQLALGHLDNAYWLAREAIMQSPAFMGAYNTLGVVYRRHGDLAEAEKALRYVMARDPDNIHSIGNLALVLESEGRPAEAAELLRLRDKMEPNPPYYFYFRGLAALQKGDTGAAVENFRKEVKRAPYEADFHFWLAVSYANDGHLDKAHTAMAEYLRIRPGQTVAMERQQRREELLAVSKQPENALNLLRKTGMPEG